MEDLKTSGLFNETVLMIGGEFGRTPSVEVSGLVKVQNGRDHNNQGFSMLLAGGGIRGGMTYGSTDDFGFRAVENPVDPNDSRRPCSISSASITHALPTDTVAATSG